MRAQLGNLPIELLELILTYTDIVTPLRHVYYEGGKLFPACKKCERSDVTGFVHRCRPCTSAREKTECNSIATPTDIFLINHSFYLLAQRVFLRWNHVETRCHISAKVRRDYHEKGTIEQINHLLRAQVDFSAAADFISRPLRSQQLSMIQSFEIDWLNSNTQDPAGRHWQKAIAEHRHSFQPRRLIMRVPAHCTTDPVAETIRAYICGDKPLRNARSIFDQPDFIHSLYKSIDPYWPIQDLGTGHGVRLFLWHMDYESLKMTYYCRHLSQQLPDMRIGEYHLLQPSELPVIHVRRPFISKSREDVPSGTEPFAAIDREIMTGDWVEGVFLGPIDHNQD